MAWFKGELYAARSLAQNLSKDVLAFCYSKNQETELDAIINNLSEQMQKALQECICVKLEEGSKRFKDFCRQWQDLIPPTDNSQFILYAFSSTGEKLAEPFVGWEISDLRLLDNMKLYRSATLRREAELKILSILSKGDIPEHVSFIFQVTFILLIKVL